MQKLSLNRNQLKYLAIAAMLIDHIAWMFVPTASLLGQIMHFIGRLTGPTMAFFIAEGYQHTRNVKKYAIRMAIFAAISWLPFVWFERGSVTLDVGGITILNPIPQSVIFTLLLALLAIWLWDKGRCPKPAKILGIAGICLISIIADWAFWVVLYSFNFYINRNNKPVMWRNYALISIFTVLGAMAMGGVWYWQIFQFGIYMVPFFIGKLYNGEPGSKSAFNKWFFYIFYPAHLVLLCVIIRLIY